MRLKQFLKTALIFLTGNVLSKLISFFLLPLYTGKISPAQFGNYDVALSFINLVAPIAFLQIWDGMYRFAFDYKDNAAKQKIISNSIVVSLFGIIAYFILFSIVGLFFNFSYYPYVIIYGLFFAFNYVYTYSSRVFLSNKLFVFSGVAATLTTAISNVILILGFKWDVKSIYFSAILGLLVQQIIIELRLGIIRKFKFSDIDKSLIKNMIKFSVPLCVATISYWLLSGYTKVLIQNMLGNYYNGIYAVTNKFASLITLAVTVIQFAWNETVYIISSETKEQREKSYSLCVNIMVIGIVFSAGLVSIASKIIFPYIIHNSYGEALYYIPITIIGVAANSFAGFTGTLFMAEKKNNYIMISTFIAAGVNVILGYFLTKQFGLYGSVTALMISFCILAVLRFNKIVNKSDFSICLKSKTISLSFAFLLVFIVGFYFINSILYEILFLALMVLAFALANKRYINLLLNAVKRKSEPK